MNIDELSKKIEISENLILDLVRKGLPMNEDKTFTIEKVMSWMSSEAPNLKENISNRKYYGEKIINDLSLSYEYFYNQNYEDVKKTFSQEGVDEFLEFIEKLDYQRTNRVILDEFGLFYKNILKKEKNKSVNFEQSLWENTLNYKDRIQIYWGNSLDYLKKMPSESIQLMVTSPPYYNARAYSQWENLNLYLDDMRMIIREAFRVLENHRVFVWNVGDIFDNDRLNNKKCVGKKKNSTFRIFYQYF